MTEEHLNECLRVLDDTRNLLDRIQTDLRGAQEFRDAVFDLLEGTPFGAQADSAYDGLYGRLRAALAEAGVGIGSPRPAEWQPIETAPKDTTEILALHPGQDGAGYMSVVWWDEALDGWIVAALADQSIYVQPTHWMPLPVAPRPAEQEKS